MALNCSMQYAECPECYSTLSGAYTTFWHGEQIDLWRSASWKDPTFQDLLGQTAQAGVSALMEQLSILADLQLRECLAFGGMYWELRLHVGQYIGSIWRNNTALAELLSNKIWLGQGAPTGGAELLTGGLCAPAVCMREQVEYDVVPQYLSHRLLYVQYREVFVLPSPRPGQVKASMLASWSDVELDFAIIGVAGCGTTSLRMNLQQHPEIRFSSGGTEDYSLVGQGQQRRLLPLRSTVDTFNQQWKHPENHALLRGLALPGIYAEPLAYHALSFIPGLRAVIIVCDPVSRFENWFFRYHFCRDGFEETNRALSGKECIASIGAALGKGEQLLGESGKMGPSLRELRIVFGNSIILLHQHFLRSQPQTSFNGLVRVLNATRDFAEGTRFFRWNVHRGHKTDLCKNTTMLRRLKSLFASEYEALEEQLLASGHYLPNTIIRQTRCDRPEEFVEASIENSLSLDVPFSRVNMNTGYAELRDLTTT